MSVKAYRINNIELKDEPSFNIWHNRELMNFFEMAGGEDYNERLDDGGGEVWVNVSLLERAIKQAKKLGLDEEQVNTLKDDIKFARSQRDFGVSYNCS